MADVEKINVGGVAYDICDTTARRNIPTLVSQLTNDRDFIGSYDTAAENDMNNITNAGYYWINKDVTLYNKPEDIWGYLIVGKVNNGNYFQMFESVTGNLYFRGYYNGIWNPWRKFANITNTTDGNYLKTTLGNLGIISATVPFTNMVIDQQIGNGYYYNGTIVLPINTRLNTPTTVQFSIINGLGVTAAIRSYNEWSIEYTAISPRPITIPNGYYSILEIGSV